MRIPVVVAAAVACILLLSVAPITANIAFVETADKNTLISKIVSADLTVDFTTSNTVLDSRNTAQQATFSNGTSSGFSLDSGVLLTTGSASYGLAPTNQYDRYCKLGTACTASSDKINTVPQTDPQYNVNGKSWGVTSTDAGFQALAGTGNTLFDTNWLSFKVQLPAGQTSLYARVVYASEEYHEWVRDTVHDVMGFWVNGRNVALVPGSTSTALSSASVNNGRPAGTSAINSAYFVNNAWVDTAAGPVYTGSVNVEYDGMTTSMLLTATGLSSGVWYDVKLGVADVGDGTVDSGLFVEANSVSSRLVDLVLTTKLIVPKAGTAAPVFHFTYNTTNTGSDVANNAVLSGTLPSIFVYTTHTTMATGGGTTVCTVAGRTLNCTLSTLAVGAVWSVQVWGTPSMYGLVETTATVRSEGTEKNWADNTKAVAGASGLVYGWAQLKPTLLGPSSGSPTYTTPFPEGRTYHTVVNKGPDSELLLFGGHTYDHPALPNDVWSFSLATRSWSKVAVTGAALPTGRTGHAAMYIPADTATARTGKMVVHAGFGMATSTTYSTQDLSDMWILDTTTNTWTQVTYADLSPSARKHHAACLNSAFTVGYIHGGDSGGAMSSDLWAFTVATSRWLQLAPTGTAPTARSHHTLEHNNGNLYLYGGYIARGVLSPDLHIYNIATNTWTQAPVGGAASFENADHAAVVRAAYGTADPYLLVFGGLTRAERSDGFQVSFAATGAVINSLTRVTLAAAGATAAAVHGYRPSDSTVPGPRLGAAAVAGKVGMYVVGGATSVGESELQNDVWVFGDEYPPPV